MATSQMSYNYQETIGQAEEKQIFNQKANFQLKMQILSKKQARRGDSITTETSNHSLTDLLTDSPTDNGNC